MARESETFGEAVRQVISYQDDVYVWVYLDQADRVIRFEAYVVGYDESGDQTTLDFVIEEGVLDNMHEVPLFWDLMQSFRAESSVATMTHGPYTFSVEGRLISPAPMRDFYRWLDPSDLQMVHGYFSERERELKADRRARWTRALKALGYDVIPSL